ncbi:MAG: hypothetical protein CSA35_01665 [Dethiosulfovibrio peptidovorans]|nr:MAG: hypothetical protein CSA35_01665 [Dethiosulfovibrio peptidovorans]
MRSFRVLLSLTLVVAMTTGAWAVLPMAIPDFKVNGVEPHLGAAVGEVLRTKLASVSGLSLVVVDKNHRIQAGSEQRIGSSGLVDPATAAAVGKAVGARYILIGSVNGLGGEISLESRLVDVDTGSVVQSFSVSSDTGDEGVFEAAKYLADDVKAALVGSS